ncbi:hypothetical protein DMH03_28660 [Amycolatopsis sp. WAC 01376]|uniref:hypothetical protein n=1 Tax=Amycolatopsis sp. WAC 01376 TaxID=2203195 RepID=UPI000F77D0F1|nr:hypothetical protein [Amycolatopsis sp. WAC 01376]RSM57215.1 hypothetical protein DMH03_28660 [Amycolatopsis sp. WAC 01376]
MGDAGTTSKLKEQAMNAVAWSDLAVRPAAEIRGSKRRWALIIAIDFAGPIAYFTWGRRPMDPAGHSVETP